MNINNNIESLLRFDEIRLFKLIEISYYTIISFIITLIFSNIVEDDSILSFIFKTYDYEKEESYNLLKDILIDLIFLSIYLYYLKKTLHCIPFIFKSFSSKYKSSKKNEINIGITLGTGIVLYTSLNTIKQKIDVLDKRIKSFFKYYLIDRKNIY